MIDPPDRSRIQVVSFDVAPAMQDADDFYRVLGNAIKGKILTDDQVADAGCEEASARRP